MVKLGEIEEGLVYRYDFCYRFVFKVKKFIGWILILLIIDFFKDLVLFILYIFGIFIYNILYFLFILDNFIYIEWG